MLSNDRPLSSHPRRTPAHLSVSLKHHAFPPSEDYSTRAQDASQTSSLWTKRSRTSSGESANAQRWFDKSNTNPVQGVLDTDPPFYLKQSESSTSNPASDSDPAAAPEVLHPYTRFIRDGGTNYSSGADDFRSVIDDLTIQNKRLKERLRKLESAYNSHLDNDKLFEVKVHGLSPHKRRELEETLRSFASSVDGIRDATPDARNSSRSKHSHPTYPRNPSSSSTSNSLPVDSAYASMSTSEPNSSGRSHVNLGRKHSEPKQKSHDQRVESFLHGIPGGLMPKYGPELTDRGKKRIVVRRLEQLFTGKASAVAGNHDQPLQQQEISKSAARADRAASEARGQHMSREGFREANILARDLDLERFKGASLENNDTIGSGPSDNEARVSEQRPTRPLDLDPERAQFPADNIDYIRHLGLDIPKITTTPGTADSEGWVYLNLLVSMAQLHMIHVTPDFIRAAVSEYSEKFELSRDGRKLRWKGGTEATRLSSDSGADSGQQSSPQNSDGPDERTDGRHPSDQKSCRSRGHDPQFSHSRFHSVPVPSRASVLNDLNDTSKPYHYRPLFKHTQSSSEEEASISEGEGNDLLAQPEQGNTETEASAQSGKAGTTSHPVGKKMANDGLLVFYSGASFVVDLSSDRRDILAPRKPTHVGKDSSPTRSRHTLGSSSNSPQRPTLYRSDSGSLLSFRPFKDYSIVGERALRPLNERSDTPDLITSSDEDDDDITLHTEWSKSSQQVSSIPLELPCSGLGGTSPADHFQIAVSTTRGSLDSKSRAKLSKFSAPNPKRRKFMHSIARTSLDSFREPIRSAETITSRLAALRADSPPLSSGHHTTSTSDMPVKIKIDATQFRKLNPSSLPPPALYFNTLSSEDSLSDLGSTHSSVQDIARLRHRVSLPVSALRSLGNDISGPGNNGTLNSGDVYMLEAGVGRVAYDDSNQDDDDEDDDDDDESIDMLAAARKIDPEAVAAQEAEFEAETLRRLNESLPLGSSAATVDGGSGKCASGFESSDRDYSSNASSDTDVSDDGSE